MDKNNSSVRFVCELNKKESASLSFVYEQRFIQVLFGSKKYKNSILLSASYLLYIAHSIPIGIAIRL